MEELLFEAESGVGLGFEALADGLDAVLGLGASCLGAASFFSSSCFLGRNEGVPVSFLGSLDMGERLRNSFRNLSTGSSLMGALFMMSPVLKRCLILA